jgi:hypothetical protein
MRGKERTMKKLTETEQRRFERTAYVALDAIDRLVGHGLGGDCTERALDAIRELVTKIQNAEIKQRNVRVR